MVSTTTYCLRMTESSCEVSSGAVSLPGRGRFLQNDLLSRKAKDYVGSVGA